MQIVESTAFALRSAKLTFGSAKSPVTVTLFPMIHVGEPEFYRVVYADAANHDVVLVEGVKSPVTVRLTRAYRWMIGSRRLDLSLQPRFNPPPPSHAKIVHADLSRDEFAAVWRATPLWVRLLMYVAAPIFGLHRRCWATRETVARGHTLDDAPRADEMFDDSVPYAAIQAAVIDARDQRLLERLREQLDDVEAGPKRVAIIYGAGHMRAVIRELTGRRGFRPTGAEWLTIFGL